MDEYVIKEFNTKFGKEVVKRYYVVNVFGIMVEQHLQGKGFGFKRISTAKAFRSMLISGKRL